MSSDNYETDSEMDEQSDEKEQCKAPAPLTKSSIEDLPSTIITSIYCDDGHMDDVSDEVFAWKKAPTVKFNKKLEQKAKNIKEAKNKLQAAAAPSAPLSKLGDNPNTSFPLPKTNSALKQKSELKPPQKINQKESLKAKKTMVSSSRDSLFRDNKKPQNESKQIIVEKKGIRAASSSLIKKKDSKILQNRSQNRSQSKY